MRHHIGKEVTLSCLLAMATLAGGAEQIIQPVGEIGPPAGTGKWPAVAEAREDLRAHTLYHPQKMPDDAAAGVDLGQWRLLGQWSFPQHLPA